ncbi:phage portal protein [Ramlibacter sp. H39-3-26]|uniref:phage portal protein n=1 Tax=Curvibacter soli TaxID=3031331 RepID=UPI0023DAAC20|nr:phage portal protein [Ramlibacter sp. H39-3-26]MDF1485515.1 phage portal protein [Ramlibacter sp. H39-3-26]
MSIITRIKSAIGMEERAVLGVNGWPVPLSATSVTPATAQGVSAVYACVQAIAETTASLPLILFKRNGDDRERATDHPLYRVLHDMANPEQTALEAREYMQACVLLRGNAFARLVRGWDGQVRELWPLNPDNVQVQRTASGLVYDYTKDGVLTRLLSHEVLHLRHRLGDDGVLGVSPIAAARGVVELAIAENQHGVSTFTNGAKLLGVLKFPGKLKPEQRQAIGASWASQHAGAANAGRTAILEEGVDFQALSMSLEDASWIEARKLSVIEVCRLFRCPPLIVQSMESANYSNSVELARQFVTMTLRRHLIAWEQAIAAKCLTDAGRRTYFAEHSVEGLLRGDSVNRAQFYASAIESGWMKPSYAARLENMPLFDGIDDAAPKTSGTTTAPQPYPSKQQEAMA